MDPIKLKSQDGTTQDVDPAALYQKLGNVDASTPITYYDADGAEQTAAAGAFRTALGNKVPKPAAPPAAAPSLVDQAKGQLAGNREAFGQNQRGLNLNYGGVPVPLGAPLGLNSLPGADKVREALDNLIGGFRAHGQTNDPKQQALATSAMKAGGMQAGKLGLAALISYLTGGSGAAGASLLLGNDSPVATAGGAAFGAAAGQLPKLAGLPAIGGLLGDLGPTTRVMQNGTKVMTPALRPGLAALIQNLAVQGGVNVGALAGKRMGDGEELPDWWMNALGLGLGAAHAGYEGINKSVKQTPAYLSEKALQDISGYTGAPKEQIVGGKNVPPVQPTRFSGLEGPGIAGISPSGTATAAPSYPTINMQDVLAKLNGWADSAVGGIKAAPGNPQAATLGGILASKPRQPKGTPAPPQQPAAAQPAAPLPEPPKDDKVKVDENVGAAASGGGPVGAGPVAQPGASESVPPVAYGKSVMLQVGDRQYPVRYVARNVEGYEPSHDPRTGFQANPRYPLDNTRNYDRPNKRGSIVASATPEQFNPARHTAADPTATNGPGVAAIDPGRYGDVRPLLGGNGRHQRELLVYGRDPQGGQGLRDAFLKTAKDHFGIDPREMAKIPQPTVKMEMNTAGMAPDDLRYVIQHLNDSPAAALTPDEAASSMAGSMTHDTADFLAGVLENNDGSLRDVLSSPKGHFVINRLIKGGVIDQGQLDAYVDRAGSVTDFGKDTIERMLNAATYRNADQLAATQPDLRNRIQRIASSSLMTRGTPYDLSHELHDAIDLVNRARAQNASIGNITDNYSMFEQPTYSPATIALAKELDQAKQVDLGKRFRGYAANAARARSASVEGTVLTPEEALGRIANNGTGQEPIPIRPRPAAVEPPPPVVPPAPEPAKAPPAAAPPPAGSDDVPPGDHEVVAYNLNKSLATAVNRNKAASGADLEKTLVDGIKEEFPAGNIGYVHDMIDAARAINPDDFEIGSAFVNNRLRNGRADSLGRRTAPQELAAFQRIGNALGMTPERAENFVEGLHSIRAKLVGETSKQKINLGKAQAIGLPDLVGRLERASGYGTAAEASEAGAAGSPSPTATPSGSPPRPNTGGSTEWTGTGAMPQPEQTPAEPHHPIWEGKVKGGVPASTPDLPPMTEEEIKAAYPEAYARFKSGQVNTPKPPSQAAPLPEPFWRQAMANVKDTPPFEGTAKPTVEQLQAANPQLYERLKGAQANMGRVGSPEWEADFANTSKRYAVKQAAGVRSDNLKKFTDFMTSLYDQKTRSFKPNASNVLADWSRKNPGVVASATDGNEQAVRTWMDLLSDNWTRYNQTTHNSTFNLWGHLPEAAKSIPVVGRLIGWSARIPRPIASRMQSAMQPTSRIAATMRYLANNPETPETFARTAMLAALFGTSANGDSKTK